MITLRRVELQAMDREAFAKECERKLSYKPLLSQGASTEVAEAFRAAGIRPFSPKDVDAYKEDKLRRLTEPGRRRNRRITAGFAVLYAIFASVVIAFDKAAFAWFPIFPVALAWAVTMVVANPDNNWRWSSTLLSHYTRPVPEYALELALQLQKELRDRGVTDVVFFVVECVRSEAVDDPFLVLDCQGLRHYLEVWDEPDFGAKRTV